MLRPHLAPFVARLPQILTFSRLAHAPLSAGRRCRRCCPAWPATSLGVGGGGGFLIAHAKPCTPYYSYIPSALSKCGNALPWVQAAEGQQECLLALCTPTLPLAYMNHRALPRLSSAFLVRLCPRLKCGSACKDKASFKELHSPAPTQSQALILHFATTTPQHCSLSRFSLSTRISKIYYYHPDHSLTPAGL